MKKLFYIFLSFQIIIFFLNFNLQSTAQENNFSSSNFKKYEGFFNFYYDEKMGEIWLEIPEDRLDEEFLYIVGLPGGVGSNDIGLDRGQISGEKIVKFQRFGNKILLIEPNYDYRALSDSPLEEQAVEDAFAKSALAGFDISEESGGSCYVNLTYFLITDAHGVINTLIRSNQGSYNLDFNRSVVFLDRTKNFPENSEFEVLLTFSGEPQGNYIREVTPTPQAVTVRQHHSFVKLPDDDYKSRAFDPRAGYFAIGFADYAAALNEPFKKAYIIRHRLQKQNPTAEKSEAIEPIIYYIDPATPPIIQQAMIEGAGWWNEAFEAAGFIDAFQVEVLPKDADPMDVRYNVVQWVHRATRGWSYGNAVVDPRTGEIMKGHVTLGSLRLRQDYLIAEALLAPYTQEGFIPETMQKIALARLRQLVAHEIGHTLGLAHNFAASTANRASVMDYPHPQFALKDGKITWGQVYDTGIGEWDKIAIAYGYTEFPEGTDEKEALNNILKEAHQQGIPFISDTDARAWGGAHPEAHLWDNGKSATEELERVLEIRQVALENFSEDNIPFGTPLSQLEKTLVPLYLFHRYQVEATIKLIGGVRYNYNLRGDEQALPEILENNLQEEALEQILKTLTPEVLAIPEHILQIIPPPALYQNRDRESFEGYTGVTFDPIGAAQTAADMTLKLLLNSQRAARLISQKSIDDRFLGFDDLLKAIEKETIKSSQEKGQKAEIQRVVNFKFIQRLMMLVKSESVSSQVQAVASWHLEDLKNWCKSQKTGEALWQAHYFYIAEQITLFQSNPSNFVFPEELQTPAGSPIGIMENWCGW